VIQWGSRARPPRLQSGQAPLSRALPRTGPRSCLAARVRREVDTAPTCSSFSSVFPLSGRLVFFSSHPTPATPLRLQNLPRLIPFHFPRALHQLRQVLGFRLRPRAQALTHQSSPPDPFFPKPDRSAAVSSSPWSASPRASPRLLLAPLGSR
jgi:hypothetical protein